VRAQFLLELLAQGVLVASRGETRSPQLVGDEQDHQHAGRQEHYPDGAQYPPNGHPAKATPESDLDTVGCQPEDCPAPQWPNLVVPS
jgi:hypothetical protein